MKVKMEYLSNKCRACLGEFEQSYALFEIYESGLTLCDILENFVNVKLKPSDLLPNNICLECASILTNFYTFSLMFKENHKKLLDIANTMQQNNHNCAITTNDNEPTFQINDIETVITKSDQNYYVSLADNITKTEDNFDSFDNTEAYEEIIVATTEYCDNSENERYHCNLCKKSFKSLNYLEIHVRRHDENKKYICEICGYVSYRKSYLDDHMEGHSSDQKYVCKVCNKSFRRRTTFCRHKQIHLHPKKYICEMCGKKFTARDTLNTHILLRHIKSRNHKCIICNESFALKATLEKHVRRHQQKDGVSKQFACKDCNVKYFDKSSLNRHYITKHRLNKHHTSVVITNENTIVT